MAKEKTKKATLQLFRLAAYRATIVGDSPILLHRGDVLADGREDDAGEKEPIPGAATPEDGAPVAVGDKGRKKSLASRSDEARAAAYWCDDGLTVGIPVRNIWRCLLNAGKDFPGRRGGKSTLMRDLGSGLHMLPHVDHVVPILVDGRPAKEADYLVDVRRVVNNGRGSVNHARPKFTRWSIVFDFKIDAELVNLDTLGKLIQLAGRREGLGDYRRGAPKPGPYGDFSCTKLEAITD